MNHVVRKNMKRPYQKLIIALGLVTSVTFGLIVFYFEVGAIASLEAALAVLLIVVLVSIAWVLAAVLLMRNR